MIHPTTVSLLSTPPNSLPYTPLFSPRSTPTLSPLLRTSSLQETTVNQDKIGWNKTRKRLHIESGQVGRNEYQEQAELGIHLSHC